MTEMCLLTCFRPRSYGRLLGDVYPKGSSGIEKNLEAQKMDRVMLYAKSYPKKMPLISGHLHCRILENLSKQR